MTRVESVAEVAHRIGCKERQVFYLLARGVLERAPRYGRELRIYSDSVDRALARPVPRRKPRAPRVEGPPPPVRMEDTADLVRG